MSHYIGKDIEKPGVLPGFRRNTSVARVLVDALRKNGESTALVSLFKSSSTIKKNKNDDFFTWSLQYH